jgi:hypothetical protein
VSGDDRHDAGVAGGRVRLGAGQPTRLAVAACHPGSLGPGCAGDVPQLAQSHMHEDLGRLPGPAGEHSRGDQPPARLLQRVVAALGCRAGVFWPRLPAQGLQHGGQGGGASRGQIAVEPTCSGERDVQPGAAVAETIVAWARLVRASSLVHLLGQARQVGQVRATGRGTGQNPVRIAAHALGQPVTPLADRPGPGPGDLPRREHVPDHRVSGQPPRPAHRPGGRAFGDPRLPRQPYPGRTLPVGLGTVLGAERGQHPRPRRGLPGLGPLQRPEHLCLHPRRE